MKSTGHSDLHSSFALCRPSRYIYSIWVDVFSGVECMKIVKIEIFLANLIWVCVFSGLQCIGLVKIEFF